MWIASLVTALRTWWRYHDAVTQLSALDDRVLKDIGIVRSEIEHHARLIAHA